jgi:hypothetical protein
MWSADLDEARDHEDRQRVACAGGGRARSRRPSPSRQPDVMGEAVRGRLRGFERRAGGRGSVWYRAAWFVFHRGLPIVEAAERMRLPEAEVRGAVRIAAVDLVLVYGDGRA